MEKIQIKYMPRTILINEVIRLLDISLGREISPKDADKIVAACIGLLRGEYDSLVGE